MNSRNAPRYEGGADVRPKVTPEIAAEAAVWIARLHGPGRNRQMEIECRSWQASSPAHREAFERCSDTWQDVPRIKLVTAYETLAAERQTSNGARLGRRVGLLRWTTASAAAAVLAGSAMFLVQWRGLGAYATEVGEQRSVVLDDGTRVLLNTDTRLRVHLGSAQRVVNVSSGEAIFEVAKDASRPFVVRVAGTEVVAVGTAFAVRYTAAGPRTADALAVTLIEGKVSVRPAPEQGQGGIAPERIVQMQPGERLQLDHRGAAAAVARVDRPNVEQVTAWKRSEAVFDDTSLADAVAEMNRYSRTPVVLVDGLASAGLRVSGLYKTGDNVGFARAVAALHALQVHNRDGRLELEKPH